MDEHFVVKAYAPPGLQEIARFEQSMGFVLPPDYRSFLVRFGGGVPNNTKFGLTGNAQELLVNRFFSFSDRRNGVVSCTQAFRDEMPDGFVVIGEEQGGALLLLGCGESNHGVFLWDHTRSLECSTESENTFEVASSFDSFCRGLRAAE